jgi:hypothetical protein
MRKSEATSDAQPMEGTEKKDAVFNSKPTKKADDKKSDDETEKASIGNFWVNAN